jgi:hypothetical protein
VFGIKRFLVSIIGAGALTVGGAVAATPAPAQPVFQEGLVNVAITDVGVQIPIALAANICDVNVAVLVSDLQDDSADCEADASSTADITFANGGGNGPVFQQGLVNVLVTDVAVQVPIGIAANVCDVNVAVLVDQFLDEGSDCNADALSEAVVTS